MLLRNFKPSYIHHAQGHQIITSSNRDFQSWSRTHRKRRKTRTTNHFVPRVLIDLTTVSPCQLNLMHEQIPLEQIKRLDPCSHQKGNLFFRRNLISPRIRKASQLSWWKYLKISIPRQNSYSSTRFGVQSTWTETSKCCKRSPFRWINKTSHRIQLSG